jgi:hypothetical protein
MRISHILTLPVFFCLSTFASAQSIIGGNAVVGGVAISADGLMQYRQTGAMTRNSKAKTEQLYVSLPSVLAEWKAAKEGGKEVPADVRYLKGLTRIEDVFIYPESHDIVLAGPAETYKLDNTLEPLGASTARPLVQLEDLIVAIRAVGDGAPRSGAGADRGVRSAGGPGGRDFFGCSLENPANFKEAWDSTFAKYGKGPAGTLQAELKKALGHQQVKLYGVPEDSRVALAMLAADYRLKRISMGLETVPGVGNALGSETAAPRIWFEPSYDALLVSEDGNSYELRGPRLKVMVGTQPFNPATTTDAQKRFGENFSKAIPAAAERIDAIADLQNVTDCFMVAALLRQDRVPAKAGLDWSWLTSAQGLAQYKVASLPVPRTADTVVHISGNVIAQGGVALAYANFSGVGRSKDGKFTAAAARPASGWFAARPR